MMPREDTQFRRVRPTLGRRPNDLHSHHQDRSVGPPCEGDAIARFSAGPNADADEFRQTTNHTGRATISLRGLRVRRAAKKSANSPEFIACREPELAFLLPQ